MKSSQVESIAEKTMRESSFMVTVTLFSYRSFLGTGIQISLVLFKK